MSQPPPISAPRTEDPVQVTRAPFGSTPDGAAVDRYTLATSALELSVITYGGRVQSLKVPDRGGRTDDVVLGYDDLENYIADKKTYFGALIGRYGNRIARGHFELDGHGHQIPINDPPNALHGGTVGFDQLVWQAEEIDRGLELTLVSQDGDQGFPGTLTVHVRYTLQGSAVHIDYTATVTTRPTVLNLTNHTYFNLAGQGSGLIVNEVATIPADRYTTVDQTSIPTGIDPVDGTPFDFRKPTPIGARINDDNPQLRIAKGYDHNFCLGPAGEMKLAARMHDPVTGRTLTVSTTEPGVQFYTGNTIPEPVHGKAGAVYTKRSAYCLETQHYPDSPNHPSFPSTVLRPGETFRSSTVFSFTVE